MTKAQIAQQKYRSSTPEKLERYKALKRDWYARTREERKRYRDAYRASNRDKLIRERIQSKVGKYGLTFERYMEIFDALKGKCQICGDKFKEASRACVDHCHNTGVIRGLLCESCNKAEGLLKTPENARKLYEYMLKNELLYQNQN